MLVASDWAPIRAFDPVIRCDPAATYGDLLPVIRRADLRIVNCECVFTRASRAVWKSGAVFKGEPVHAAGLALRRVGHPPAPGGPRWRTRPRCGSLTRPRPPPPTALAVPQRDLEPWA